MEDWTEARLTDDIHVTPLSLGNTLLKIDLEAGKSSQRLELSHLNQIVRHLLDVHILAVVLQNLHPSFEVILRELGLLRDELLEVVLCLEHLDPVELVEEAAPILEVISLLLGDPILRHTSE